MGTLSITHRAARRDIYDSDFGFLQTLGWLGDIVVFVRDVGL